MTQIAENFASSGIAGLDRILFGGIYRNAAVLLRGTAGSGKTTFGLHVLVNGARQFGEPGIILSFEPFPEMFYREALSFGFDLRAMEAEGILRVIFANPDALHSSFAERESEALAKVTDAAIDLQGKRLLIDSVRAFWMLPLPKEEQNKVFQDFVNQTKALGLTVLMTSEAWHSEESNENEEFASDVVLSLSHSGGQTPGARRQRYVEVTKARGQRVQEGRHPFVIRDSGITVSPYVSMDFSATEEAAEVSCQRESLGVPSLDALLNGGVYAGTTTLLAGVTGSGKTILAAHFAKAALESGEPILYVAFHERPEQLLGNFESRGIPARAAVAEGRLSILRARGAGLNLIEFYHLLEQRIVAMKARRLVIDGFADFLSSVTDERERNYFVSIYVELLRRHNVTTLLTNLLDTADALSSLATIPQASLIDNVIYLGLMEYESRLRKILTVFKVRGDKTDNAVREVVITNDNVHVSDIFHGLRGVLQGSATGTLSEAGSDIVEPILRIRDFVNNAEVQNLEAAQYVLENIREEFDLLARNVGKRYEVDSLRGDSEE